MKMNAEEDIQECYIHTEEMFKKKCLACLTEQLTGIIQLALSTKSLKKKKKLRKLECKTKYFHQTNGQILL